MKNFFKILRQNFAIISKLYGKYLYLIPLIVALGLVGSFSESIGVGALVPLFSRIVKIAAPVEIDSVTRAVEKIFSVLHLELNIYMILAFISAMFLFKAVSGILISYISLKIKLEAEHLMRQELYSKMLASRWPYLSQQKFGYLQGTIWVDVAASSSFLQTFTTMMIDFLSVLVYIGFSFFISPLFSLMTLFLGGAVLVFSKPLYRRFKEAEWKTIAFEKEISHEVNENIVGLKTIKAMNVSRRVAKIVGDIYEQYKDVKIKQQFLKNIVSGSFQPISVVFIMLVFSIYSKQPGFNFASFISVLYLIQRSFIYLERINGNLQAINSLTPHLEHLIQTQREVEENQEEDGGITSFAFRDSLSFKNVSFNYPNNSQAAVLRVNFSIQKGEMVGIIGPSGAGKTTVVDLLLRLLSPQEGEIVLDLTPIQDIALNEWRRSVGYVSQDTFLKNMTIGENIAFYDEAIGVGAMEEAAKMANLSDFIAGLPKGFDTVVEDRGINLSGGQRQKIVLARILARKPKVLVLDEATSALDAESEQEIKRTLDGLRGKVTIIVIAHRISTVLGCDTIIAFDNGQVREEGKPSELLKDKDSYLAKVYELGLQVI
ncbi:MAG: ABC transporter ATP-binding protein [Candidatus Sungbacteria bacterium]|nr:ABC transporter ATP-binding protein [Candidatus Sungbacteria bacterium]